VEPLNITETCEISVRSWKRRKRKMNQPRKIEKEKNISKVTQSVSGHHDAILVLDSKHRGTSHNRLPDLLRDFD